MTNREFIQARHYLDKTQSEMAQLLGTSTKAIQSYEQGWRVIPTHSERQVYFLVAGKQRLQKTTTPCWTMVDCPSERRNKCPAWEFQMGNLCWFINGTICEGKAQRDWKSKMKICVKCKAFQPLRNQLKKR